MFGDLETRRLALDMHLTQPNTDSMYSSNMIGSNCLPDDDLAYGVKDRLSKAGRLSHKNSSEQI